MPLGLSAGGVTVDVALSASGLAAVVGSEVGVAPAAGALTLANPDGSAGAAGATEAAGAGGAAGVPR